MSRTDKDRPWRIRAADRSERRGNNLAYFHHDSWSHTRYGQCSEHCGFTLPYGVFIAPPHSFVHDVWWGPERGRERRALSQLADRYNATGDVADDEFANWQHRHCARWLWF